MKVSLRQVLQKTTWVLLVTSYASTSARVSPPWATLPVQQPSDPFKDGFASSRQLPNRFRRVCWRHLALHVTSPQWIFVASSVSPVSSTGFLRRTQWKSRSRERGLCIWWKVLPPTLRIASWKRPLIPKADEFHTIENACDANRFINAKRRDVQEWQCKLVSCKTGKWSLRKAKKAGAKVTIKNKTLGCKMECSTDHCVHTCDILLWTTQGCLCYRLHDGRIKPTQSEAEGLASRFPAGHNRATTGSTAVTSVDRPGV